MYVGIGALYLRRRPRVRVVPIQSGGGQERGIRSGTVPTPLAVGLGAACQLAQQEMDVSSCCSSSSCYCCRCCCNSFYVNFAGQFEKSCSSPDLKILPLHNARVVFVNQIFTFFLAMPMYVR